MYFFLFGLLRVGLGPRDRDRRAEQAKDLVAVSLEVFDQGFGHERRVLALGDRQANGLGDALAQRAACGINARRKRDFGEARGQAAELAEILKIVERQGVSRNVKHAIKQDTHVAARKDQAIAVDPLRIARIGDEVVAE